jgi:hypothetical protein
VSVGVDYDFDHDVDDDFYDVFVHDFDFFDHVVFVFGGAEVVGAGAVSAAFVACEGEGEAVGSASFGAAGDLGLVGWGRSVFGVFGAGAVAWCGWGADGCESDVFVCVAGAGAVGGSEFLY